jgi:hypothetical protein
MGIICSHIGFRGKRIFCVTCVKKTKKKCSVNSDVEASNTRDTEMLLFSENLCATIKCLDIHGKCLDVG